jgi:hypothetical protein
MIYESRSQNTMNSQSSSESLVAQNVECRWGTSPRRRMRLAQQQRSPKARFAVYNRKMEWFRFRLPEEKLGLIRKHEAEIGCIDEMATKNAVSY